MPILGSGPVEGLGVTSVHADVLYTKGRTKSDGYSRARLFSACADWTALRNFASASGAPTLKRNWRHMGSRYRQYQSYSHCRSTIRTHILHQIVLRLQLLKVGSARGYDPPQDKPRSLRYRTVDILQTRLRPSRLARLLKVTLQFGNLKRMVGI